MVRKKITGVETDVALAEGQDIPLPDEMVEQFNNVISEIEEASKMEEGYLAGMEHIVSMRLMHWENVINRSVRFIGAEYEITFEIEDGDIYMVMDDEHAEEMESDAKDDTLWRTSIIEGQ